VTQLGLITGEKDSFDISPAWRQLIGASAIVFQQKIFLIGDKQLDVSKEIFAAVTFQTALPRMGAASRSGGSITEDPP
jgi:hypothetical protein